MSEEPTVTNLPPTSTPRVFNQIQTLICDLDGIRKRSGISYDELATTADLPLEVVGRALRTHTDLTRMSELSKIAFALDMQITLETHPIDTESPYS